LVYTFEYIAIEGTSQATIRSNGDNEYPTHLTLRAVFASYLILHGAGQVAQNAVEPLGIGAHTEDIILRTAQLSRRHHFHGFGDLLRALHRYDAAADFF
jgi:hypothetical protein